MKPLTKVNLLLVALCAALGAAAYDQLTRPVPALPEAEPLRQARDKAEAPSAAQPFRMPPKAQFVELVERPPFSSSRKPPLQPTEVVSPKAKTVRDLRLSLVGVVIAPDKSIAVLSKRGAAEAQRISRGEKIDGWLLEGVMPDRVILTQGKDMVELELKDANDKRASRKAARKKPKRTRDRKAETGNTADEGGGRRAATSASDADREN